MTPKRGLRTPLPQYVIDRLKAHKPVCILTAVDRSANVGEPLLLINEKLKPVENIRSWAIVEMEDGIKYPDAKAAVAALKDAVDEVSAREYLARNPRPTWAYKLKLIEAFATPHDVEAAGRRIPNIKFDDDIAFVATIQDSLLKGIPQRDYNQIVKRLADIWDEQFGDGQVEPDCLAREEVIGAALLLLEHGHADGDRYLYQIASKISKAEETYQAPKAAGTAAARGLEWRKGFGRGGTQIGVRRATQLKNGEALSADTVLRMWSYFRRHEVDRKAEGFNEGEKGFPSAGRVAWELWGGDAAYEWLKRMRQTNRWPARKDLAPVHPGSDGEHEPLDLDEVVEHVKPIVIRENAVMITGSLPQWETTRGDIDVLIKNPLDEGTRKAIEFRVGRAFPPEISERIEFLDDDLGGSFTTHVPLYDLALVPKTHQIIRNDGSEFVRIEMAEQAIDKADPYLLYPANPNKPVRSVFQTEYQGKSVHIDWRIAVRANQLVGWTLFVAKQGAIGQDVMSFDQAQRFNSGLTLEGNRVIKPLQITGGQGLQAVPKRPPPPPEWLDVDRRAWDEELKDGKRRHVMVAVDRPMVQFGRNEPYFKEYFLTRGQRFNGTAFIRATVGRGGTEEEEESGRVTPEGQIFWRFLISDKPLPSILRRRSVRLKRMPPNGTAAIPRDLMALVPAEYRYWEKRGEAARAARDALVESRFFTENNVVVVGGRYKRIEERKKFYSIPQPTIKAEASTEGKYKLVWQTWRGKGTQRDAPTRQVWHLMIRTDGKKYAWTFQENPLVTARSSATSGVQSDADWDREGEVKPGTVGLIRNESKATPSFATLSDSGSVSITMNDGFEISLKTKVGNKRLLIKPEEAGSKIWVSELLKSATAKDLDDYGLVSFGANGPEIIECACGGRTFDRRRRRAKCDTCHGSIEIGNASYVWELKAGDVTIDDLPVRIIQADDVPTRHGIQIWDPEKVDDRLDRRQLKPLAIFAPMKPRDTNSYKSVEELVDRWKKAGSEKVFVEPKLNGRVIVAESDGDNVLLFFEDSRKDKTKVLPSLAEDLRKAHGGPFVIIGELLDYDDSGDVLPRRTLARFGQDSPQDDKNVRIMAFRMIYVGGQNLTAAKEAEQYEALNKWKRSSGTNRIDVVPRREATTEKQLRDAVKWASGQPGSEGAMIKDESATYSLGGHTSSWSKLKLIRTVKVIVLAKTKKAPSPTQRSPAKTWVYTCGIGPVKDVSKWKETAKIGDQSYVVIGKTGASNVQASKGDVLEVDVLELLIEKKESSTIHWFGPPMAQDVVGGSPMTPSDIEDLARPDEIDVTKDGVIPSITVPIGKADEFQGYFKDVVLKPNDGIDGPLEPDTQDDTYTAARIEHAMRWNAENRKIDNIQHGEHSATGPWEFIIIQNYLADVDFWLGPNGEAKAEPNDWRLGVITPPDEGYRFIPAGSWIREGKATGKKLYEGLKRGEFNAWSIEGYATRVPTLVDIPPRRTAA